MEADPEVPQTNGEVEEERERAEETMEESGEDRESDLEESEAEEEEEEEEESSGLFTLSQIVTSVLADHSKGESSKNVLAKSSTWSLNI